MRAESGGPLDVSLPGLSSAAPVAPKGCHGGALGGSIPEGRPRRNAGFGELRCFPPKNRARFGLAGGKEGVLDSGAG